MRLTRSPYMMRGTGPLVRTVDHLFRGFETVLDRKTASIDVPIDTSKVRFKGDNISIRRDDRGKMMFRDEEVVGERSLKDLDAAASSSHPRLHGHDDPLDHTGYGTNTHSQIDTHLGASAPHSGHVQIGGQLGGTPSSPDVRGLRETVGPTLLAMGAVADGEYMKRSGTNVVGGTPAAGGDGPWTDAHNFWLARASGASILGVGVANPTITAASAAVSNDVNDTWHGLLTAATGISQVSVVGTTYNLVRRAHNPTFWARIRTPDTIGGRFFVGLFSAAPTDADNPAGSYAAFRYSSAVDGTSWKGMVKDGTTQQVSAAVAGIAVNSVYNLKIRIDGTAAYFSVNAGAEQSLSVNLPAAATELGFWVGAFIETGGIQRTLGVSRCYCVYA